MAKRKAKKTAGKKAGAKKKVRKPQHSGSKLPKEAVTLVVLMRARPGQQTLLEAELRALVGPSRKEEDCITYDLHRSADAVDAFLLHEVWASREAHNTHTNTPHFLRWNARKDSLLASRDLTFWKFVL